MDIGNQPIRPVARPSTQPSQTPPKVTPSPPTEKPIFTPEQIEALSTNAFPLSLDTDYKPSSTNLTRSYEFNREISFDHSQFESKPLTKSDIVDGARDFAEGVLGEDGTKALIGVAGIAHLATGGSIDFSQKTDDFIPGSKLDIKLGQKSSLGFKLEF